MNLPFGVLQFFTRRDAAKGTPRGPGHAIGGPGSAKLEAAQREVIQQGALEDDLHDLQYQGQVNAIAAAATRRIPEATTPGSVMSEELEPLPVVTEFINRMEYRLPAGDDEESQEATQLFQEDAPSSEQTQDGGSPSAPRRKLRRAGDSPARRESSPAMAFSDSSSMAGSPVPQQQQKTAFDLLKQGALKAHVGAKQPKPKEKKRPNEFVAEQADESDEEEGRFGSLFKSDPEAGEDETNPDDEDLDGELEELVDDEKVDAALQEEQDALAQDRFQQDQAADDAKQLKMAQKVAAGEAKKRKRGQGDLSDSDYEDDEGMYRKAKERKPVKFNDKVEAIGTFCSFFATIPFPRSALSDPLLQLQMQNMPPSDSR